MSRTRFTAAIDLAANRHGVDPKLVESVVVHESAGERYAWRPEPRYRWLWDVKRNEPFRFIANGEIPSNTPPSDFRSLAGTATQEWQAQRASWGLMQIMGALARELGYRGPYLTALTEAAVNLDLGCQHLAALLRWADGHETQALAAYNGGKVGNSHAPYRNVAYAEAVLKGVRT